MTTIELALADHGNCGVCGQPALYDYGDGKLVCASCMITRAGTGFAAPGSLYGPGYAFHTDKAERQRMRDTQGQCPAHCRKDGHRACTLGAGHSGLHEAWSSSYSQPMVAWDADGTIHYTESAGWVNQVPVSVPITTGLYGPGYKWLGRRASGTGCGDYCHTVPGGGSLVCSLAPRHLGLHEGWGTDYTNPVGAWTPAGVLVYHRNRWTTPGVSSERPARWQGAPYNYSVITRDGYCGKNNKNDGRYWDPVTKVTQHTCTLPVGHSGWHESWDSNAHYSDDPRAAWDKSGGQLWKP